MAAEVRFILGRSGSGKTHSVYSRILENERAGRRSFLIVPDRATFETERELAAFLGGGMMFASVLSFTRLSHRILAASGGERELLSSQGRRMLIRRVLDESASKLSVFGRVGARPGFVSECEEMILKCKRYSITPEEMTSAVGLPEQLKSKLNDFALIYSRLNEKMSERYIDGEDLINAMIVRLPDSEVKGADVFIDAPDMLNEQSVRIIDALFDTASSLTLTFRCGEGGSASERLFEPDMLSVRRIKALASAKGCAVTTQRLTEDHRHESAPLKHLEANLFAFPPEPFNGDARGCVELHVSADRQHEVREAADRILRAVKSGLRFRDIAVALGDAEGYSGMIRRCFADYGISFFMDSPRSVASHPVSALILSALRCAENNFRAEDFIAVLKTGLSGISDESCEILENHILEYALSGSRLYSEEPSVKDNAKIWDFKRIEASRIKVAKPILELKKALSEGGRPASAKVEALFGYLSSINIAKRIKDQSDALIMDAESIRKQREELMEQAELIMKQGGSVEEAERILKKCDALPVDGDVEEFALESRQIYDSVIEMLDQIHLILGDEAIGLSRFISVVKEGLEAYEVNVIPTKLDQVLVGDITATHLPEVKLLLVLGVNEGQIPRVRADNAIINDRDLGLMRQAGINAWDTTEAMNRAEELNLYSVLFKAKEALYLSYSKKNGSAVTPASLLLASVGGVLSHCARTSGILSPVFGGTDRSAFADLAAGMRGFIDTGEADPRLAPLYAHFAADEDLSKDLSTLEALYFAKNSPDNLDKDTAKKLYGSVAVGAPTQLQTFNKCPFRYLMTFGLKLRERKLREEKASDFGKLIHSALEKLMNLLIDEDADYSSLTTEDIAERLDSFLPELIEQHNSGIMRDSALMRAEADGIREEIIGIASVIAFQLASGSFKPYACEYSFGRDEKDAPALVLTSEDDTRFKVTGVVDRVDILKDSRGKTFFRIIDYKTGSEESEFDYSAFAAGIKLQLPLYAAAVRENMKDRFDGGPSGMYYMKIGELASVSGDPEEDEKKLRMEMRLSGPTLSDREILIATDGTFPTRTSKVIDRFKYVKKTDSFESSQHCFLSTEEMAETIEFAKQLGKSTLDKIMAGRAEVSPVKLPTVNGCDYCPYMSICRFDPSSGSKYRRPGAVTADTFYKNRKEKEKK